MKPVTTRMTTQMANPLRCPIFAGALLCLLALPLLSGCKRLRRGADGDNPVEPSGAGASPEGPQGPGKGAKATAGCAAPESPVTSEVTIPRGCSVTVKDLLIVEGGGVLKIEAGARLAFAPNAGIQVRDAKLVIAGTEKEPAVLTSANRTQAAGDWAGVLLDEGVMAGSAITNARVEYAGQDAHGSHGAITMNGQRSGKRLAITGTTFQNNDRSAVWADSDKGLFAKFERNVFKANKLSVSLPAAVLGSVGPGNVFGDPLETHGEVSESTTWGAFGAPVIVREHLLVRTEGGSAPTLTIAPGSVLKFAGGTYLSVGEGNGGGLVAPRVTFTTANATPHAGDWAGLFLYKRSTNVNLEGGTIEYAGADVHGSHGAITLHEGTAKDLRGVKLTGLQVKSALHAALYTPDHDCGEFAKQIVATGAPVCSKE